MKPRSQVIFSSMYGVSALLVSLALAWAVMFTGDFFYGIWHDYGGIKEGIEKYGPENRYKPGFADTTRAQRVAIFREINIAVHRGGQGLEDIVYQSPTSGGPQVLLREPEVTHLQDVAKLIDMMMILMAFVVVIWPIMAVYYFKLQGHLPKFKYQLIGIGGILLSIGVCLSVFGAETTFNQLHIWIFPSDNQWFFYYQDSLMSTMMLAPLLFAWIAAAWLVLSIVIYLILSFLLSKGTQNIA